MDPGLVGSQCPCLHTKAVALQSLSTLTAPQGRSPALQFHPWRYFEKSALINLNSMVPLYIFPIILINFSVALSSKSDILGPNSMSIYNSNKYYKLVIIACSISTNSIVRVVSLAFPLHPCPVFSVV